MLARVQASGCTPFLIAAFSAGSPSASHPIGCITFIPRMVLQREITSVMQ